MSISLRERHRINRGGFFKLDESRVLLARPTFPELFIERVELEGEPLAYVCQDPGQELVEGRRSREGQTDNGASAALDEDDVVGFDAEVGRTPVNAKAGLDRLASFEHGREKRLDENREVNADLDLRFGELILYAPPPTRAW